MAGQVATIKELILGAAEGAVDGVSELQAANVPVELDEFEIEVTYTATTEIEQTSSTTLNAGVGLKFKVFKASFGVKSTRTSRRKRTETYGLKVRFLFSGVDVDPDGP